MTGHLSSAWSLHRDPEWAGLCCDACLDGTAGTGTLWVPPFVCNALLFWETPGVTTALLFFLTTGLSPHLEIYKNSVSPVQPILSIALLIWAGSLVSLLHVDYGVLGSLFSLLAVGFVMAGPRSSAGCTVSA